MNELLNLIANKDIIALDFPLDREMLWTWKRKMIM